MSRILVSHLADAFQMHPDVVSFFVGGFIDKAEGEPKTFVELKNSLPPVFAHQLEYNLTHIQRGEKMYQFARSFLPEAVRLSVLDIGCGIGGTLRAFGAHGFDLYGVELDERRHEMCLKNFAHN